MSEDGTSPPPEIAAHPGVLPPFWDRNAVFVANLLGLFFGNEEETRLLAEEVGEVDSYGGRLIPIIDLLFAGGGRNLLVLEREPDASLCRYFEEVAGLSLPEWLVLPHGDYVEWGRSLNGGSESAAWHRIAGHPAGWMDGYVTDATLEVLANRMGKQTISTGSGSQRGNNKRLLHQHLESIGLPVPATVLAESPQEVAGCLRELKGRGFSAGVVKSAIGASGIGLIKVDSLNEGAAVEIPRSFFYEGPCLVQGWLKPGEFGIREIRSPSVQMFLDDDGVALYDITEQILSRASIHEGNEAPPPYLEEWPGLRAELLRQAGEAGQWLHTQGYRGTGSTDFVVTFDEAGEFTVYVCEINARVTGATYPAVLARHFMDDGAWLLRNLRFTQPLSGAELLGMLEKSGDLYVPGKSETGVLPVNFNFGRDGLVHKGQFLCLAHSTAGSHVLLELAELDLPCEPDRD